ncbi:unnamed protein product [Rangifer tarandus platyrhynchus]|uniref:Uncharacterized protein n=1 Tax=Rangifer tarandus platyrhynchus TaxID=3082113 RepID=A0AC59ZMP8_RANTA
MTFVLGADATAGVLEETRHKGEGRRVAKGDRDREVPRGSVPGSLGCGGRCGVPPSSCLRERSAVGSEEQSSGGEGAPPGVRAAPRPPCCPEPLIARPAVRAAGRGR